jgi:hypothetical protein
LGSDFSADFGFRLPFALFLSGCVRYFLRNSHEYLDENPRSILDEYPHGNCVQNVTKTGEKPESFAIGACG